MGNGQGIKDKDLVIDIETSGLTLDDLENSIKVAQAQFGQPTSMFMGVGQFMQMQSFLYHPNPEFQGLPWSSLARLTKREYRVAALHHFLWKLKALKNMTEEDHEAFQKKAVKRLKKAKWARNAGKKKA